MKAHDVAFIKHAEKGKFHHASFYLDTWQDVLMAADLFNRAPLGAGDGDAVTHG